MLTIKIFLLLVIVVLVKSADETANVNLDAIVPSIDQDFTEKDHSKRTLFSSLNYDNYAGWAKHVELRGRQKLLLGYTPVDLKYVPVIKPSIFKSAWRFKPRPAYKQRPVLNLLPVRPRPDSQGWKPIIAVPHVPPPPHVSHKPWQTQGWTKPEVTMLKPIKPSAPDHHHVEPTVHIDDAHLYHHHHHHHDLGYHFDDHYVHSVPVQVQAQPQFVYYNPLVQVTKPDLPVLPLGAAFPVPVSVAAAPTVPQSTIIPDLHLPVPTYVPQPDVHPHYHYLTPQHQVPQLNFDLPHLHHQVPEAVYEIPAPHFHPTPQSFPVSSHVPTTPTYHGYTHVPQVHEHVDQPIISSPVSTTPDTEPYSVEYHGHIAHLIHQNHNAHQYVPENYNPHLLPGSTGSLSPGFLNPGYTDLQIPEHLPHHPNYAPTDEDNYYHQRVGGVLPEGIVQPAHALEPPINK